MLKDKGFIVNVTLPALASTNTARAKLADLGLPESSSGSLEILQLTSANATFAKAKGTDGLWYLVATATGSVSANTVVSLYCQVVPATAAVTLVKDA